MFRQDYIPFKEFNGSAGEWLEQECARQKRLGVRTGQRFYWSDSDLVVGEVFEEKILDNESK